MSDSPTVTLRAPFHDDWEPLYALLNQEEVLRWSDDLPFMAEEAFREQYVNNAPGVHRIVGEVTLASGRKRVMGFARLHIPTRRRRHMGELRFFVHPEYHGSALEAGFVQRLLAFADEWLGLARVQVVVHADHTDRRALLVGQGFAEEAVLRRYVVREGAYRDACLLARLRGAVPPEPEPGAVLPDKPGRAGPRLAVLVRGIEEADWEDIADLLQGEQVIYHTLQLPYQSRDAIRDRLENPPENAHFLVAEVEGRVVGQVGLHRHSGRRAHSASLGMMVRDDYQGQGVGSALLEAALELGEGWLQLTRIALEVYPDNAPALALYRRFGFEPEGTLRRYAFRAGQLVDTLVMARLAGADLA